MVPPSFLMSRSIFFLLFTIPAVLTGGCATTVSGRLEGPELGAEALFDARVNVTRLDSSPDKDEPTSMILVPDSDGTFESSENLPKGKYLIEALVPGYEPVSMQLDLIKSQTVKLVLKPLGQARARTSEMNSDPAASRGEGGALLTLPQF
jgi:hypothetical protein